MNFLRSNKFKKITKHFVIGILGLFILLIGYSILFEQDKIVIDAYNFEQLEKVKTLLKNIPREDYRFTDLKSFNKKYNKDIKPKNNCYYIASTNYFDAYDNRQGVGYIFGFQLESLVYRLIYFSKIYAYPKYDLPYGIICYGICEDRNRIDFEYTISHPCEED